MDAAASPAAAPRPPVVAVRGLRVVLPDGRLLLDDVSLEVRPGEVVVLLGGSGAGKSTFARVLFEREALERDGFEITVGGLGLEPGRLGLVPQRGALFDHLDVRGNLELGRRYAEPVAPADPAEAGRWLERLGLDPALARPGTPVATLSGGQAQRVAVARVLAARRQVLFLDEPSVGLDPHHVRVLARLLRRQCDELGVAAIVVTHDVALAAGVADRLYLLDPGTRRVDELFAGEWPGALEAPGVGEETRGAWLVRLERELTARIGAADGAAEAARPRGAEGAAAAARATRRLAAGFLRPFGVAATALARLPAQLARHPRDALHVGARVLAQTVARPLLFYAVVSTLIGYTVLYVISKVGASYVRPDALVRQIGGAYVVALAPVLSAVLFVAASGSATNAWLGGMGLTRQTLALEALGVDSRSYLWAPAWLALGVGYLVVALVFALGMTVGGWLLCRQYGMAGGWELLTADLLDPREGRLRHVVRAAFLVWIYAWGIGSDVVARGSAEKPVADAVPRAMTASVVACTLWVVTWELATATLVLAR